MALTKAQISLVTVATIGAAPGGFTADLMNFGSQKDVANLIASLGLLETGTNAEYALQVAKNLNVSAGDKAVTDLFKALEGGATRADATVDFANGQLVAQGGKIANVETAIDSNSTSTDLGELGAIVSDQAVKAGTTIVFTDNNGSHTGSTNNDTTGAPLATKQTIAYIGKDAGLKSKISADFTFELKDQIGEDDVFTGMFLSPMLDRAAPESEASTLFLKLLDGFASRDGVEPVERLTTNGFGFTLDGVQIDIISDGIKNAKTYVELKDAITARLAELAADTSLDPAYAKLVNFEVSLGETFTRTNQEGDDVTGRTIDIKDTKGGDIVALGYSEAGGVQGETKVNIIKELTTDEPGTITKAITTNLEADNVGFGSQGATVNLVGQSNSDKGIETLKVTTTNDSWFTTLESQKNATSTNHLARIEVQGGSDGYFRVGTQENSKNHVVGLGEGGTGGQNFGIGGLTDVQQLDATLAGSTAINSFVSSEVLKRYDTKDTGTYTADDEKAAITYNLASAGENVLNLAINTKVLEAVDTKVNVKGGSANDVITVYATEGFGGTVGAAKYNVASSSSWLANQQLLNNVVIDAGAGNDYILTPGAGNATILAGAGDDQVRVDNTGDRAVLVFNTQNVDINALVSNSNAPHSTGANASPQTFKLIKAQVQVTFKGFESAWITIDSDSKDFTTNTLQINQAIKKAVNDDLVLQKLLKAYDNEGNALGIESLIDGELAIGASGDLKIEIKEPAAYNASEDATQKAAREAEGKLMLGKDDVTNADKAYLAASKSVGFDTASTANDLYDAKYGTTGYASAFGTAAETQAFIAATAETQVIDFTGTSVSSDGNITVGGLTVALTTATHTSPALIADAVATALNNQTLTAPASGGSVTATVVGNTVEIVYPAGVIATQAGVVDTGTTGVGAISGTVSGTAGTDATGETNTLAFAAGDGMLTGEKITITIDGTSYTYTATADLAAGTDVATAIHGDAALATTFAGYSFADNSSGMLTITQNPGAEKAIAAITSTKGGNLDIKDGGNSLAESDNVINLGSGNDLLVMGTGAQSEDTLKVTGYNNGTNTIVNFETGTGAGADLLDFTSYLTSVDATNKALVPQTVVSGTTLADNGVTIVDFNASAITLAGKALSFKDLTADNVKAMINKGATPPTGDAYGNLDLDTIAGAAGSKSNYVLLVENKGTGVTANNGEYKAFHVTSTGNSTDAATVQLIGTFDFGDTTTLTGDDFVLLG